jgi:alkylhydroperoxidase family enzyme
LARRHGATDAELETLDDLARSPLPPPEQEAIRFAERMTRAHGEIGEADLARLRESFEVDQVVELLCVIGLFNYLNRFAEAVALEPTKPGEGGPGGTEGDV